MPLKERDVQPLKDANDVERYVKYDHEKQFANLILQKNKFEITYEPTYFEYVNGRTSKHLVDFKIVNLRTGGSRFVEITTSRLIEYEQDGEKFSVDPKSRERGIVEHVKEEDGISTPYVVLYAGELQNIQNKYEGIDFFRERNQQLNTK